MAIQKAAVIGAGVMGAGIAAHIANSGTPVILLDIVAPNNPNRNAIAESAVQKLLKTDPAPFMHARCAKLVQTGNIEDHLDLLKDVDWIVEAVIEKIEIKQDLYKKIDAIRKTGSIVSSNTSTIPLEKLTNGLSDRFKNDFMITHFFNPPRYMRLLEIVKGKETRTDAIETMRDFADRKLGKGVVFCKDTPGFIANRIGTYWIHHAATLALQQNIQVEEADALISRPMGIPKTGVFALMDLVGLDLMPHVLSSMRGQLPKEDAFSDLPPMPDLITKMIQDGYTGRKGKGGFYRLATIDGKKVKESIDLQTGFYRKSTKPKLAAIEAGKDNLRNLLLTNDKYGAYAWKVLSDTLLYAATLVPETAETIVEIDEAMRLGYNWKYGPFELLDRIGACWFRDKVKAEGRKIPALLEKVGSNNFYQIQNGIHYFDIQKGYQSLRRAEGILLLSDIKKSSKPLASNESASLWDIGDNVTCLEFTSKMNSIDQNTFDMIQKAIEITQEKYKALVIYNEGSHFSAGANIGMALFAASMAMWPMIEDFVANGQKIYKALKYAPFPVIGAPSGIAVGGGCEILLHCDAVQAHAETYMGLVEVGVGLVPAWGGCKEMLTRSYLNKKRDQGPMPVVAPIFEMIATAKVAKSAYEAQDMLYLRDSDAITMNRDRLLADAKKRALEMVTGYKTPLSADIILPGATAKVAMEMAVGDFHKKGVATDYDVVVAEKLSTILSGGNTDITETITEDQLLMLEREAFMPLVQDPRTLARIQQMLETGKPLRN